MPKKRSLSERNRNPERRESKDGAQIEKMGCGMEAVASKNGPRKLGVLDAKEPISGNDKSQTGTDTDGGRKPEDSKQDTEQHRGSESIASKGEEHSLTKQIEEKFKKLNTTKERSERYLNKIIGFKAKLKEKTRLKLERQLEEIENTNTTKMASIFCCLLCAETINCDCKVSISGKVV